MQMIVCVLISSLIVNNLFLVIVITLKYLIFFHLLFTFAQYTHYVSVSRHTNSYDVQLILICNCNRIKNSEKETKIKRNGY